MIFSVYLSSSAVHLPLLATGLVSSLGKTSSSIMSSISSIKILQNKLFSEQSNKSFSGIDDQLQIEH